MDCSSFSSYHLSYCGYIRQVYRWICCCCQCFGVRCGLLSIGRRQMVSLLLGIAMRFLWSLGCGILIVSGSNDVVVAAAAVVVLMATAGVAFVLAVERLPDL
jgi:hypothetical protein